MNDLFDNTHDGTSGDWRINRQPYKGLPPHADNDTSLEAALDIAPKAGTLRRKVYEHLLSQGEHGATDFEGFAALGMIKDTYAPRRRELVENGLVVDGGERRLSPSGKNAKVWVAKEHQNESAGHYHLPRGKACLDQQRLLPDQK